MKRLPKYIYCLICTIALAIIVFCVLHMEKGPLPRFCISGNFGKEEISMYEAEDGDYYVFLPSYAELEELTVAMSACQQISIGGVTLSNGMTCGDFVLETAYPLEINGRHEASLWFYKSANVATMYIDTATGSMKKIHEDKNYEENASVTLYTEDGEINFHNEGNTLKGRGNATWEYDKRPYSLMLSSPADLLNMGTATNWVLLANVADETNLNNYLVFDLASRVGFSWTPECRYVDLYLNGEYSGLYLLAEKVEVGVNRLNIDPTTGDFLFKFDYSERWNTLRNPFLTNTGRTVEISYPEILQQTDYTNALSQVNRMEQVILSGVDLHTEKTIDLDSWVRRYLIDEISANIDADIASSYFYFVDGAFYAGPIWDYDMSWGNSNRNQEPNSFIAKNAKKSETFASPYYSALYENESFYNRMIEIYRSEFLPLLQQMVDDEIHNLSLRISNATQMNSIRWRSVYDTLQSWNPKTVRNTADLIAYLDHRISFLNHAWLENTDFCTVQFEFTPGGTYWNISVPRGSLLETSYVDLESTVWIDSSTQEIYDFSQPIMGDLILSKGSTDDNSLVTRDYVTFLSIAILLLLFGWLVVIDVLHRHKERSTADERRKTKISS